MTIPDYLFWSATRAAREIRDGNITSTKLVEACFDRLEKVNPKINAAVQLVEDRALKEAANCDDMTSRGDFVGPLHGVPISIKDSLDTEGVISTGGTMGRKDFVPEVDAPVVARLRKAGGIVIAKTNTPELTLSGETNNLIYGRTSNPYDVTKSPGGSSGGTAAILAVGGSYLDLGSDTGGSIREPSHYCGVAGIKPSSGRTPRTGHIVPFGGPLDGLTQIGPMARYVEDLCLALPIICGPDGVDPWTVPVPHGDPYEVDLKNLKLAWYIDNDVICPSPDMARAVEESVAALSDDGLQLINKKLPQMPLMSELFTEIREAANANLIHGLLHRFGTTEAGPDLRGYLEGSTDGTNQMIEPSLIDAIDEVKSRALMFMQHYDAIVCPASHDIARAHGASYSDGYDTWSHTTIHNLLGWPGIVVRAGTSQQGNLPVGVQVVTAPWNEHIGLAIAKRIETLKGGFQAPNL